MRQFRCLMFVIMLCVFITTFAQNYTVKGVVIDAKGNSVIGAEIKAKKSKTSATTENGGVYSLSVTPKETELSLIINKYQVMSMPVSVEIAKNPLVFQMTPQTDPTVTGYLKDDTYYVGEIDNSFDDIINKNFANSNIISSCGYRCNCYIVDGTQSHVLTITSPSQMYSI
ncbi:MAG: hypothetical protein PHD21_02215 [Flavobacteriales bacterium]|nr:hypothetical protein [Flavobacteriales bacterium]